MEALDKRNGNESRTMTDFPTCFPSLWISDMNGTWFTSQSYLEFRAVFSAGPCKALPLPVSSHWWSPFPVYPLHHSSLSRHWNSHSISWVEVTTPQACWKKLFGLEAIWKNKQTEWLFSLNIFAFPWGSYISRNTKIPLASFDLIFKPSVSNSSTEYIASVHSLFSALLLSTGLYSLCQIFGWVLSTYWSFPGD